uniref:Putative secreted protein n=1 Tax=Anopheles darlingi TaxID=43151 RepID=A0A2M4D4Z3_ANODA
MGERCWCLVCMWCCCVAPCRRALPSGCCPFTVLRLPIAGNFVYLVRRHRAHLWRANELLTREYWQPPLCAGARFRPDRQPLASFGEGGRERLDWNGWYVQMDGGVYVRKLVNDPEVQTDSTSPTIIIRLLARAAVCRFYQRGARVHPPEVFKSFASLHQSTQCPAALYIIAIATSTTNPGSGGPLAHHKPHSIVVLVVVGADDDGMCPSRTRHPVCVCL